MSDIGEYTIILFDKDLLELKEILNILLNIIFFHRNLSDNNHEDVQSKLLNITYVKLKSVTLSKEIENLMNDIEKTFMKEPELYGYNLTLSFFEKSENTKKNEITWEKWNFISILTKKEDSEINNVIKMEKSGNDTDRENKIREYIFKVIEKLNDKANYMPDININDQNLHSETFAHTFNTEIIKNKEHYLSLFNNFMQKNQDDIIVINL